MRLPRRVPWAHIGELEQVSSWVYADDADLDAKALAINRLSAWKAAAPLPHALDSTLAVLAARMLDASHEGSAKAALTVRQAYAMAIIRMVNGLVDPLQSGAYARSIAVIASQLGLPSWLVELRHAATHEDLPSLELLREASKESLSWLLCHYFQPTLNPSTVASTPPVSLRPLSPLFDTYKRLVKAVTRDESLRKQHQGQIDAVMRDIERWITEAKVSAELAAHPLGWGVDVNYATSRVDTKERWALEILCDTLFERGGIVPVSKKKCCLPADPFLPASSSLALWTPLLLQLHVTHAAFPSILVGRIVSNLLDDLVESKTDKDVIELDAKNYLKDELYSEYLARWATWVARTWTIGPENGTDLKKEIVLQVVPILIPGHDYGTNANVLNKLLQAISMGSKDLEENVEFLRAKVVAVPSQPWKAQDLVDMEERLQIVVDKEHQTSELFKNRTTAWDGAARLEGIHATGWRLLDERSNWRACPIGVYHSETAPL